MTPESIHHPSQAWRSALFVAGDDLTAKAIVYARLYAVIRRNRLGLADMRRERLDRGEGVFVLLTEAGLTGCVRDRPLAIARSLTPTAAEGRLFDGRSTYDAIAWLSLGEVRAKLPDPTGAVLDTFIAPVAAPRVRLAVFTADQVRPVTDFGREALFTTALDIEGRYVAS